MDKAGESLEKRNVRVEIASVKKGAEVCMLFINWYILEATVSGE